MKKYYTRVCNFYYGKISRNLIKKKKSLQLNGNKEISFDHIEILSRNSKKLINIKCTSTHADARGVARVDMVPLDERR